MTKNLIINAWDIVTAVINKIDAPQSFKMEARAAADLLRETAEKSFPKPNAQTATALAERATQTEMIANCDGLANFATLLPYLVQRREFARMYIDRPDERFLEHLTAINKQISQILNIF
jgi:hypothetical protein